MIIFLSGKDLFRLIRHRAFLKAEFRRKYPDGGIRSVDCEEPGADLVVAAEEFLAPSLFDIPRLLSVEHAEKAAVSGRASEVFDAVSGAKDRIVIVSYAGTPKASEAFAAFILERADRHVAFEPLRPSETAAFILDEGRAVSPATTFSCDALEELARLSGGDSARLSSEARKLAVYRPDQTVTGDDVRALAATDHRENVFAALDDLVTGRRGKALSRLIGEARFAGTSAPIFGMIAWQLREFFRVRGEYERGNRGADDIARAIGGKPFVVGKVLSRLRDFPEARVDAAIALLARLDLEIKTGRTDGETATSLFVEKF